MALLKDLIVQGAARIIGDAYFATVKAGVWNGTPIDLSHGGTAGTTTANQVLLSTSTSGTSTWGAQSSLSVGSASRLSGTSSYTAWGKTYWSNGVPSTISGDMTSVGNITPSANISKNCGSSSNAWLNIYGEYVISNTTLYLTSAASTPLIFRPQGTEAGRFNTSGNLIIGLASGQNDITTQKLYVDGATTITGTLTLSKTQDLAGTANNSPALIIGGPATGVHMEIDSNEIHTKQTGTTVAPLYLNNEGGLVYARGKVLAEQDATTTTAGLVFVSTTTVGRGEWKAASTVTSGNATYAANVGAAGTLHTNYVTAAEVIAVYNWYATMIDANNDSDTLINRWKEVCDFLNNFTEADTLASILSTYVTLGTAQTITGAKTFANPISGDLLGNATTADRLKSTTAVGSASLPVYFTGGLPVACTASSIFSALSSNTTNAVSITVCGQTRNITPSTLRTSLGLGTVYSHAHTDYVTNVSYDSSSRKLQQSKGGGAATDIVTFGTGAFATIANYLPLAGNSTSSPMTGIIYVDNVSGLYINSHNTNLDVWHVVGNSGSWASEYGFNLQYYGAGSGNDNDLILWAHNQTSTHNEVYRVHQDGTFIFKTTPKIYKDASSTYLITHSTGSVGGTGTPVYVDANGQIQTCTAFSSASVSYASSAGQIRTQSVATNASYYLTFVDSNNSSATAETLYTDAGITYNPSTNLLTVEKLTASGVVNFSGSTTIDSLTAGSLIITGASSLTGNVSMGTVTAGTWNGSVIDVAHGGTGCSTLTSGSALIGNGTGAVTFRSIDNTTTVGSLVNLTTWAASTNLVTRNVIAHWDGRYQTTSNASNLAYCNKGAFGDAATRTYATAISTASGTTSASNNNYNSDSYVPTNKAVYNYVTSTLGVAATIEKTSITKSLNSSTWTETGYTLYGESQGSYMLQITDTTTAAVFTGVFSVYHGSSATGNDLDEIPLHMCASATNKVRIYAATQNGKLLVSSQDTSATNHALTIKYKKIL